MFTMIQRNKNVWDQKNKNQPDKRAIKRANNISWKRKKERAQWYIEIQKNGRVTNAIRLRTGFPFICFFVFKHTYKHIL